MTPFSALGAKLFAGLSVVLLILVGWLFLQRAELQRDLANEAASHSQTKASVAVASAQATGQILSNLSRVNSEQEKVNEERLVSLNRRLADAHRLRAESEAAARRAYADGVSSVPPAAGGVTTATDPTAWGNLADALRHDELITWVEETHKIKTSPIPQE